MSIRKFVLPAILAAMLAPALHAQQPAAASGGEIPPRTANPPAAAGAVQRAEDGIDIRELIAQVAARENRSFLVDPRVRAQFLVIPAIENPSYDVLLSVLRVHGYAAVEIEGRIHIVPDTFMRVLPTRVLQRDDNSVSDDEIVTRVLTVSADLAPQLVPVLRPMLPVSAHLAATADNRLIIVDRYDNVRRITEVVRILTQ
jgi:general secretion pathway protein D